MIEQVRESVSQLVRWCPVGQFYHTYLEDAQCPADDCGSEAKNHRLRRRRMLICSVDYCRQAFFTKEGFNEHECGEVYS
jgi:hypothetical protein